MTHDELTKRAKACGIPVGLLLTLTGTHSSALTYWRNGGKMRKPTSLKIRRVLRSYEVLYKKHKERLENGKKDKD
jgi:hypothetical protein